MKILQLPLTAIMIFVATAAFAQTDTVFTTLSQENGTLAPQQFMSEYDRAFGTMTHAKWMFKVDLAGTLSQIFDAPGSAAEVETKISDAVSIGMGYQYEPSATGYLANPEHQFLVGVRWYYDMKKRMAAGKSAANFSGNYLGLESAFMTEREREQPKYQSYRFSARWGVQRRLLSSGFFDLSYALGAKYVPSQPFARKTWLFSLQPRTAIGLARFTPRSKPADFGTACDILKCFQESRRMFKIDLYNLIRVGEISTRSKNLSVNPSLAYEQKIGKSPFSVELSIAGTGGIAVTKASTSTFKGKSIDGTGMAELRWYFLQRKRILQGKSGNNLAGVFFGLHAAYTTGQTDYEQSNSNYDGTYNLAATRAIVGIQHRIMDHGFVQFKIGAGQSWRGSKSNLPDGQVIISKNRRDMDYFAEVKAGFAF